MHGVIIIIIIIIIQLKPKHQRIVDIWLDKYGVIILPVFHNTSSSEAFTREAAMIDAIGIWSLYLCNIIIVAKVDL